MVLFMFSLPDYSTRWDQMDFGLYVLNTSVSSERNICFTKFKICISAIQYVDQAEIGLVPLTAKAMICSQYCGEHDSIFK